MKGQNTNTAVPLKFITLVGLISGIFFLTFALVDGPVWCVDSAGYVDMIFTREPGYPLFLLVFRQVLGTDTNNRYCTDIYLVYVVIFQSLLWAYASSRISCFAYAMSADLHKDNHHNQCSERVETQSTDKTAFVIGTCALLLQLAVPILNRFFVPRNSMYSESIMTEALAMPLFELIVLRIYAWIKDSSLKNYVIISLSCFLIVSIRKQMVITLLLWGVTVFVWKLVLKETRIIRDFFIAVLMIAAVFLSAKLADRGYNYILRGVFEEHIGNYEGALCTLLYSADYEDAELFERNTSFPDEKELFTVMIDECDKKGLLLKNADEGIDWVRLSSHYADSYDLIGYTVMMPICHEYISEKYPDQDFVSMKILENDLQGDLIKHLLGQDKNDLLRVFAANLIRAFVYSNASLYPKILIAFSALIYVFFIFVFAISVMSSIRKSEEILSNCKESILFSSIVFSGLCINAVTVALLIFPQGRYMTYTTALFYTSILLMADQIIYLNCRQTHNCRTPQQGS